MIVLDCVQGSPEWHAARCGIVTASAATQILAPGAAPRMPKAYALTRSAPAEVKRAPKQNEILCYLRAVSEHLFETDPHSSSALKALIQAGHVREVQPPADTPPIVEPLKPSSQRNGYLYRLLHEWITGSPAEEFGGNKWTEHGLNHEAQALDALRLIADIDAKPVGLVYRDETRLTAASPDAMAEDAAVELKCPAGWTHLRWLDQWRSEGAMPAEHVPQVQYQLWVTRLPRAVFLSYAAPLEDEPWRPGASMPPLIAEVEPDPRWQDALDEHVPAFVRDLLALREVALEMGCVPWRPAEKAA